MSSADRSSFDSDFARAISRRFEHGRFLIVGANAQKLQCQFAEAEREADAWSHDELASKLSHDTGKAQFETAVWFYSSRENEDEITAKALSSFADAVVLMPAPGTDAAMRRPQLVACFGRFGFVPDYECDLIDLNPAAVCVRRQPGKIPEGLVGAMENALARANKQFSGLQGKLQVRDAELKEAHHHIAALEEKLLKVKEYRRELRSLKEQRQTLRKSPERRIGQVFLAPYRVPEKLAKKIWKNFQRDGKRRRRTIPSSEYQKWFEQRRATTKELKHMRDQAPAFVSRPLISVITPVFDTPVQHLGEAIESVLAQAYDNWELVLVDDGSTAVELLRMLPQLAASDERIVLARLGKHGGISAASNHGLTLARGEWLTFLDHDDVLEPDSLFQVVKLLQSHPDADLIYTDEDKLGDDGFEAPLFKPDWSPDFFLSCNYLGHLTAVRRDLLQKAGGFRSQFDSAQDYDLFFRIIERTNRIHHIPRVLYHWRRSESSSAISVRQKPGQLEASRLAIEDHLKRSGELAHVAVDWRTHAFCVRRELLEAKKISVIIRSCHGLESLERCIETLTAQTSYPNYEVVIVQADKKFPEVATRFSHRLLCLSDAADDSTAKNQAVEQTDSPWLLFLDDSIEVIDPHWLTIMAEHVQRAEVGAVGARLLNPSGAVEHAGIVVGANNIAQPAYRGFPADQAGAASRQLQLTRNCSAVSSACMLTRREIFQEAGGFDANLSGALADVDLCLKIRRAGYLIVYTPFARLYWHDAPSKIDMAGQGIMEQRWAGVLHGDPYYNPNLSRERVDFSLGK
ncbi:MAG TPA: glycosyltransferase [Candidatus Udaeobacter sp.]|nr:glycosyltransferase [Candidatus Udaeobacter sp.]